VPGAASAHAGCAPDERVHVGATGGGRAGAAVEVGPLAAAEALDAGLDGLGVRLAVVAEELRQVDVLEVGV
jgi:hypothetical protein